MQVITKISLMILITIANVFYWRNRGIRDKENFLKNSNIFTEEITPEPTKDENCDYSSEVFVDTFDSPSTATPTIFSIDSNEFDQYRSKYLVNKIINCSNIIFRINCQKKRIINLLNLLKYLISGLFPHGR